MNLQLFEIEGLALLKPRIFSDDRGFFFESFNQDNFNKTIGKEIKFVQDNHSFSTKKVLRGIHFQLPPYAQSKFVRVLKGKIFDVAVDIRPKSKTFGQSVTVELTAENHQMLYVPIGFAHGFLALTDCEVEYSCGEIYSPKFERGLVWNDPSLNINWPNKAHILSEKDKNAPHLSDLKDELNWTDEAYFIT